MPHHKTDTEPVTLPRLEGAYDVERTGPEDLIICVGGSAIAWIYGGNVPLIAARYEQLRAIGQQRADDFIAGIACMATHEAMAVYQGGRGAGVATRPQV